MRNFKKNLIILIIIFPIIILLSSVFAEKSLATHCTPPFNAGSACGHGGACGDPSLILCADSQMCVANYADCSLTPTLAPTSTPTPTRTPTPIPPTPTSSAATTCAEKGGFCIEGSYSCGGGFYSSNAPGCGLTKKCCLLNPTPTSAPTPYPCIVAGGACFPSPDTCTPGYYVPSSLSCGTSGTCCVIASTPKTHTLKWTLITSCNVQAPTLKTTSFCENFTNPDSCNGNGCTWQDAPEIVPEGGFCTATTPTATPTPTSAPIGPTAGPSPTAGGPTSIPTPTPTPAIACAKNANCNNPPECRTVEGRQCINPGLPSAVCIYGTKPKGVPCKIGGQNGVCSNNGFCDLSAPVASPTATPTGPTPTGSPTPTPTPIPAGITSAHFKVALFGIADNPSRPTRKLNIEIFNPENNNAKIADLTADISHDPSVKQFKKNHALDANAIPKSGIYNIKVKSDGYLRRLILSVRINKGVQNDVPLAILIPGDINGDNKIDLLDYNLFITCYGTRANLPTCDKTVLKLADFDDNIVIDGIDYNTFIKGLSVKEGD